MGGVGHVSEVMGCFSDDRFVYGRGNYICFCRVCRKSSVQGGLFISPGVVSQINPNDSCKGTYFSTAVFAVNIPSLLVPVRLVFCSCIRRLAVAPCLGPEIALLCNICPAVDLLSSKGRRGEGKVKCISGIAKA